MSCFSVGERSIAWGGQDVNRHIKELSRESQQILFETTDKYCLPKISKILPYLIYRVINAVKSIFGQSDWQRACRKIATQELRESAANKQILDAKTLFISTLLEGILTQSQKPNNNFGYDLTPSEDTHETLPVSTVRDNVEESGPLASKNDEDSQVTVVETVIPAKPNVGKIVKSVNERIDEAYDSVMARLKERLTVVRIQTAVRKQFLRNRPAVLSLSAFQNALRVLERAVPQQIIKGDYDKMIDNCIEHCSIMENRVGLQRIAAYVMGAATQYTVADQGDQKKLYAKKGELLRHLLGLPEIRARDLALVLRDNFGMARESFNNGLLRTNLAETHEPLSSLWLGSDENAATPEEEAAKKELRELQGKDFFARLLRNEVNPREQELHTLLDKAKAEKQRQVIGKVRRVQHGGGLYYLKAWCSGLRPGYPLANGKGLGIWVHPKKVDESLGDEIIGLTCGYSKRAREWFDVPAALTAAVAAEHVLATDVEREGTITTEDRVHLRKPLSYYKANPKEKVFSSEAEEKHVLKALQVNSLSTIDWQKGPVITDAAGRRQTNSRQEHTLKKALDSIYGSKHPGLVERVKTLVAAEKKVELETPKYAYDLLNLKQRNLASFWMLQILHDEHGLSWDELGASKLHAHLQENCSPDVYAFISN